MTIKKYDAYRVHWDDSCKWNGWRPAQSVEHSVSNIESVGWLIRQDEKSVTLTTSVSSCDSVMDGLTIPRKAITKISKIKGLRRS